jgi:hypothetical protein
MPLVRLAALGDGPSVVPAIVAGVAMPATLGPAASVILPAAGITSAYQTGLSWWDAFLQTIGLQASPSLPANTSTAARTAILPSTPAGVPISTGLTPDQEAALLKSYTPEQQSYTQSQQAAQGSADAAYYAALQAGAAAVTPSAGAPTPQDTTSSTGLWLLLGGLAAVALVFGMTGSGQGTGRGRR